MYNTLAITALFVCAHQSCGTGAYSPAAGSPGCTTCDAGFSCSLDETQTPSQCVGGQYAGAAASQCELCPVGHYCPATGMTTPTACSDGYYTSATGQTTCDTQCPEGYACPDRNNTEICTEGYFSALGSAACSACDNGYYASSSGKHTLLPPAGTDNH